jgi:hypothetical protein
MKKVTDMQAARKAAEHQKYRDSVLEAYDRIDRSIKRDQREQAAEVRRNARNKL